MNAVSLRDLVHQAFQIKELLILTGLGVIALLAEIFNFKKGLFPIVLIGLVGVIVACVCDWAPRDTDRFFFSRMLNVNDYALAFTIIIAVISIFWFLMSEKYFTDETNVTDHFALVLFALVGAFLMVSYSNMTMLFLGIETLSIPMYVLVGSRKNDLSSNESAFKYFLMGAFASGFLLFGITLIYGVTGSFDLGQIALYVSKNHGAVPALFYAGGLLMLVGMSFKVSAAPFHFWAPDVYQGAPTVITAFMATVVKTAAFGAFFRLFWVAFNQAGAEWSHIMWVMAVATLLIGNITAVFQSSVKRLLAYSSIAHAGFMFIAILAMGKTSASAILYYAAAYSLSSLTAFLVLYLVMQNKAGDDSIDSFNGLVKKKPFLAGSMAIALLSLSGIPPLAGFFAKYFIFVAAIGQGFYWLVGFAILGSLIGVYYYFKIIIAMFFRASRDESPVNVPSDQNALLFVLSLLIVLLGLMPEVISRLL
ncbi:MAG TPA: NADH-quinone oxidoreductase subunit N [Bacteroidia bacterium]|jgi:NADH-quinone oxidoreductase subunit N|nr:NADH-quinone oxidoreductase subunit N [Bacteroidia bacterium]